MPDIDPILGLNLPLITDPFSTSEIRANWEKLAGSPGILHVANYASLPTTWGSPHRGMLVYQADEEILWRWIGSAWTRQHAVGLRGTPHRVTSPVTVATGTFTIAAQVAISIPPGGRAIRVTGSWSEVTGGPAEFALFKGATQLQSQKCLLGSGGTIAYVESVPAPGAATYSLRVRNTSTTTTVAAVAGSPITLDTEEI